jgi:hypothetical protein
MVLLSLWWPPSLAEAMLVPPDTTAAGAASESGRAGDLQKVQRVLEHKLVQQRLQDLGLTAEDIHARLDRASDAQVHELALQIDSLVPGGDLDSLLHTMLTAALIVLVVVVILILV